MPRYPDYRPQPQYGRTLRDVANGGVPEMILAGGDAQADAYLRGGAAWGNAIGGATQAIGEGLQRRKERKDQQTASDAVRLATSPQYPSATQPVPGSASDVPDSGMNHIDAILSRVSPEMRPHVEASIEAVQASRAKVDEQQRKLQQAAADHWYVTASGLEPHLQDADGGIGAANVGAGLSEGVPGADGVAKFAQDAARAYAQAPDEQSKAAVADAFRKQVAPLIQRGKAGGSLEAQKTFAELQKSRAETAKLQRPEPAKEPKVETRSVEVQMADALARGDEEGYQRLLKVQRDHAAAGRDPEAAANRTAAAAARDAARFDTQTNHSYEYNDKKLEAMAKPLRDQADRYNGLVEMVNEKTPQADALIAPKLLTVMVGGQGTGVRITKGEIESVLGGRSHWADLETAVKKWVPGQALSITNDQRAEIQKLLVHVGERNAAQTKLIEEARSALIDAKDVTAHRRILADLDSKLNAASGTGVDVKAPDGKTYHFNSNADADVFKKRAGIK